MALPRALRLQAMRLAQRSEPVRTGQPSGHLGPATPCDKGFDFPGKVGTHVANRCVDIGARFYTGPQVDRGRLPRLTFPLGSSNRKRLLGGDLRSQVNAGKGMQLMGTKLKMAGWLALGAVAGALATMQLQATARSSLSPLPLDEMQQLAARNGSREERAAVAARFDMIPAPPSTS